MALSHSIHEQFQNQRDVGRKFKFNFQVLNRVLMRDSDGCGNESSLHVKTKTEIDNYKREVSISTQLYRLES